VVPTGCCKPGRGWRLSRTQRKKGLSWRCGPTSLAKWGFARQEPHRLARSAVGALVGLIEIGHARVRASAGCGYDYP
jgi:hypothetical protein